MSQNQPSSRTCKPIQQKRRFDGVHFTFIPCVDGLNQSRIKYLTSIIHNEGGSVTDTICAKTRCIILPHATPAEIPDEIRRKHRAILPDSLQPSSEVLAKVGFTPANEEILKRCTFYTSIYLVDNSGREDIKHEHASLRWLLKGVGAPNPHYPKMLALAKEMQNAQPAPSFQAPAPITETLNNTRQTHNIRHRPLTSPSEETLRGDTSFPQSVHSLSRNNAISSFTSYQPPYMQSQNSIGSLSQSSSILSTPLSFSQDSAASFPSKTQSSYPLHTPTQSQAMSLTERYSSSQASLSLDEPASSQLYSSQAYYCGSQSQNHFSQSSTLTFASQRDAQTQPGSRPFSQTQQLEKSSSSSSSGFFFSPASKSSRVPDNYVDLSLDDDDDLYMSAYEHSVKVEPLSSDSSDQKITHDTLKSRNNSHIQAQSHRDSSTPRLSTTPSMTHAPNLRTASIAPSPSNTTSSDAVAIPNNAGSNKTTDTSAKKTPASSANASVKTLSQLMLAWLVCPVTSPFCVPLKPPQHTLYDARKYQPLGSRMPRVTKFWRKTLACQVGAREGPPLAEQDVDIAASNVIASDGKDHVGSGGASSDVVSLDSDDDEEDVYEQSAVSSQDDNITLTQNVFDSTDDIFAAIHMEDTCPVNADYGDDYRSDSYDISDSDTFCALDQISQENRLTFKEPNRRAVKPSSKVTTRASKTTDGAVQATKADQKIPLNPPKLLKSRSEIVQESCLKRGEIGENNDIVHNNIDTKFTYAEYSDMQEGSQNEPIDVPEKKMNSGSDLSHPDRHSRVIQAFTNQNAHLTDVLEELEQGYEAGLLDSKDNNQWRAKGIKRAVGLLKKYPKIENLEQLNVFRENRRGIGASIVEICNEILETGTCMRLLSMKSSDFLQSIKELQEIHGVGPRVSQQWYGRGICSVEAVRRAGGMDDMRTTCDLDLPIDFKEVEENGEENGLSATVGDDGRVQSAVYNLLENSVSEREAVRISEKIGHDPQNPVNSVAGVKMEDSSVHTLDRKTDGLSDALQYSSPSSKRRHSDDPFEQRDSKVKIPTVRHCQCVEACNATVCQRNRDVSGQCQASACLSAPTTESSAVGKSLLSEEFTCKAEIREDEQMSSSRVELTSTPSSETSSFEPRVIITRNGYLLYKNMLFSLSNAPVVDKTVTFALNYDEYDAAVTQSYCFWHLRYGFRCKSTEKVIIRYLERCYLWNQSRYGVASSNTSSLKMQNTQDTDHHHSNSTAHEHKSSSTPHAPPLTPAPNISLQLQDCQRVGLLFHRDHQLRMPRTEVAAIASYVYYCAQIICPGILVLCCGSFRRGKGNSGDCDILISHPAWKDDAEAELKRSQVLRQLLWALQIYNTPNCPSLQDIGAAATCDKDGKKRLQEFCRAVNIDQSSLEDDIGLRPHRSRNMWLEAEFDAKNQNTLQRADPHKLKGLKTEMHAENQGIIKNEKTQRPYTSLTSLTSHDTSTPSLASLMTGTSALPSLPPKAYSPADRNINASSAPPPFPLPSAASPPQWPLTSQMETHTNLNSLPIAVPFLTGALRGYFPHPRMHIPQASSDATTWTGLRDPNASCELTANSFQSPYPPNILSTLDLSKRVLAKKFEVDKGQKYGRKEEKHDTTWMGFCRLPPWHDQASGKVRRIDIKLFPATHLPFAMLYFTGSDHFNRSMRFYAKKMGYSLSESSLCPAEREGGVKVSVGKSFFCTSEEDVFEVMGLDYVEPWYRNVYDVI